MDTTATEGSYVVLTEEASVIHANWIAGGIEAAGIPAHVEQDDLADEFSMFQKLQGAPRVRVLVPADRLQEARTVFLALSQPIPLVEEDDDALEAMAEARSDATRTRVLWLILLVFVLPTVGAWLLFRLFG